ncbi:hypothetical protein BG006_007291 [Podila minutissima]|uniref:Uncharacterized protein n=1 Tax=Podila minutissima TaxID=64525 RepID=A0A9P5SHR9_9FUNG|nr:hypothetical protein BG006_007291 [Podila minutissima]
MFDFSTKQTGLRGYASYCYVDTKAVQHGQNHVFYLIQSIAKELPPSFYIPTIDKLPSFSAYERNETTATMEAQISVHADFPQDKWFYIKSKASGLVLDVEHDFGPDHTMLGANIELNHQKLYCSSACHPLLELQLWRFKGGFLINGCTGLVLDVDGLLYKTNTRIVQWSRSNPGTNTNQQRDVSHGLVHVNGEPNLVLDVDDNAARDDTLRDSHTAKTDKRISNEYESSPLARVLDVEHSPQNMQLKEAMSVFLRDIYSVDT